MKKLGFREFLFLVPALFFILVFSLYPVLQSLSYTVFDYQLNDQRKSGLFLEEQFNLELARETEDYIKLYLENDRDQIESEQDLEKVDNIVQKLENYNQQFVGEQEIISISQQNKEDILAIYEELRKLISDLQTNYSLNYGDDLEFIVNDLKNSIIPSNFIGLQSFKSALTDSRLGNALWNTLVFTTTSVFFEFILGLGLALLLNKAFVGRGIFRTASLIPWAIPGAVGALMWSYLYDGSSGIIALIFQEIGLINNAQDLLLTGSGAMVATILADVWKTTPYMAILLLAGLQTIPKNLYEASSIDGANKIQAFFKVTLPLLKPAILVALLFRTLDAFRVHDLIWVLTGGGPGGATETMSIYAYKTMFSQANFGYGSVIVMIMFVCVAIISITFVKFLGTSLIEKR